MILGGQVSPQEFAAGLQKLGLQDLAHVPTNLLLADFFADERGLIGLDQFIKMVGGGSFASALSPSATNLVSSFLNMAESSTDAASRGRLSHAKLMNLLNQRLRNTGCSETFLRYSGSLSISFNSVAASLNSVWNSALIDQVVDKTNRSVTPESFVCALRAFVENNSTPEEGSKLAAAVADLPPLILQSSQVPYSAQSPQPPMSLASFDPLLGFAGPILTVQATFPEPVACIICATACLLSPPVAVSLGRPPSVPYLVGFASVAGPLG